MFFAYTGKIVHIGQVAISFGQPDFTTYLPKRLVVQKVKAEPWASLNGTHLCPVFYAGEEL
jgi:hypothetical protein